MKEKSVEVAVEADVEVAKELGVEVAKEVDIEAEPIRVNTQLDMIETEADFQDLPRCFSSRF